MTIRFNTLAAVAAAGLLTACATAPAPVVQPFQPGVAPGELIHTDSGFAFPSRIGSFLRVTGHQYDSLGRDVSVGYNGDIPVVVTVYVYPAEQPLEADLVEQSAAVLGAHPGATVVGQGTVHVTPEGVDARSVAFAFSADFYGKKQPLHSELVLARHGETFVKYRITYPESLADLAAEDSSRFLQHFAWP
jgi:hypothetical protein